MSMIILNGSPKGAAKDCNSRIYAEEFVRGMKNPCEIRAIAHADPDELASQVAGFDTVIVIMPLYIHAMPGIAMRFFERMRPAAGPGKSLGFIIQAGFMETAQHRYLVPYLEDLARQLNYRCLGVVCKGEAAGTYMYPNMFKKVFVLLNSLGNAFEETGAFDPAIVKQLGEPYALDRKTLLLLRIVSKVGLANIGWNSKLKENKAFARRFDRPFA